MKKDVWSTKRFVFILIALGLSWSVTSTAVHADTDSMQAGKQSFEKKCGACHLLKTALTTTLSKGEWNKTVKSMVTYGAQLDILERNNVTAYLAARSSFTNYCSTCHDLTQVVSDDGKKRHWHMTINQMSDHFKELAFKGMTKGKDQIADQEKAEIADLLTVLLVE